MKLTSSRSELVSRLGIAFGSGTIVLVALSRILSWPSGVHQLMLVWSLVGAVLLSALAFRWDRLAGVLVIASIGLGLLALLGFFWLSWSGTGLDIIALVLATLGMVGAAIVADKPPGSLRG